MNIDKARKLKAGDLVHYPTNGSEPAGWGEVTWANKDLATTAASLNIRGTEYIWVEVKGPSHKSIWPSNRLG